MLKMNLHRSRITGSTLQAAPGSWCLAVTLPHKATQNGTTVRCRTRNGCLLLSVLRSFTHKRARAHTHTHTHTHKLRLFHLSSYLYLFLLLFLLLSSPLFLVCFSLSLSIRFCLVFLVYTYLSSLHYYIFLPCSSSFSFCFFFSTSFSLFLPSLSIPFCLVFFVYILLPYIPISFSHFYLYFFPLNYTFPSNHPLFFCSVLSFLSFRLSPLPLPLVYFSSFSNFLIFCTYHLYLTH